MNHLFVTTLAGLSLLLASVPARAQDQREGPNQQQVFDRMRGDLDRVHADALPFSVDRDRVMAAMLMVNRCQRAVIAGDYDKHLFEQTVTSLQRVMDLNHLSDQSRTDVGDDIRAIVRLEAQLESASRMR